MRMSTDRDAIVSTVCFHVSYFFQLSTKPKTYVTLQQSTVQSIHLNKKIRLLLHHQKRNVFIKYQKIHINSQKISHYYLLAILMSFYDTFLLVN